MKAFAVLLAFLVLAVPVLAVEVHVSLANGKFCVHALAHKVAVESYVLLVDVQPAGKFFQTTGIETDYLKQFAQNATICVKLRPKTNYIVQVRVLGYACNKFTIMILYASSVVKLYENGSWHTYKKVFSLEAFEKKHIKLPPAPPLITQWICLPVNLRVYYLLAWTGKNWTKRELYVMQPGWWMPPIVLPIYFAQLPLPFPLFF
ncbi:MAG: hypothetical protein GXO42_01060 [bacterium]|nr:hypothetical protein [bacterium]